MAYRNKYGTKIKRTKNLYRKKKTRAQKIMGTVLLIAAIIAIFFIGFCLGKPLLEFFEKNANREDPQWTPPTVSSTEAPAEAAEETTENTPDASAAATPSQSGAAPSAPDAANGGFCAITAPSSALSNTTSLAAFAAKSKSEGYSAVIVVLKDSGGYLHYRSELEQLEGTGLVLGTLRPEEIVKTLSDNGLPAIASVSVLTDNAGCAAFPDMSYKIKNEPSMSWFDYSTGTDVRWANPASEATVSYHSAIIGELKSAGFSEIQLTGLVFPELHPYDREYLSDEYFAADRYKMLEGLVHDGAYIEMKAEDVIAAETGRTAELLADAEFLRGKQIVLRIDRESFPTEDGYPADAVGLVEDVLSRAGRKTAGLTIIPELKSADYTADELAGIKLSLENAGYSACFVKN